MAQTLDVLDGRGGTEALTRAGTQRLEVRR
jgi:hypothetical protein